MFDTAEKRHRACATNSSSNCSYIFPVLLWYRNCWTWSTTSVKKTGIEPGTSWDDYTSFRTFSQTSLPSFTQLLLYSLLPYSLSLPTIMIEESSRWCSFLCWMLLVAAPGPRNLNNFCNTHLGSKHLQTLKARVNYSVGPPTLLI